MVVIADPPPKTSNEQRKAEKLRKVVHRADTWRRRVWAEQELRIQAANTSLTAMGFEAEKVAVDPPRTEDELKFASTLKVNN